MKKFCKFFCLIFVFALCLTPSALKVANADDDFINISDVYALTQIAQNPNANYRLADDINLNGQEFAAIQNFTGTFDGNGHTISNFVVSAQGGNVGFFANTSGANIQDVQFQNVTIQVESTTDEFVSKIGVVAGLAQNTYFTNVSVVSSTINVSTPSIQYIGSLVGHAQNGSRLQNISVQCSVNGTTSTDKTKYIGGTVGCFDNSQAFNIITNATFASNASQNTYQGGAFGNILGNKSEIKNIVINGNGELTNVYGIAGLISYPNDVPSNGAINFVYTTIEGDYFSNTSVLNDAYTQGSISFNVRGITAQIVAARNLMIRSFYTTTTFDGRYAWDFDDIWQIEETITLPYLQHFSSFTYEVDEDRSFSSMAQAPSTDAITILPSTNTFTYGSSIVISGYINTSEQMNMFFEISGLRKDNDIIFSNHSIVDIIQNEDAQIQEIDENTTTYTLNNNTVTQTQGIVNNNAGTWYRLNSSNIRWGVYEANGSSVNVYEINNCTAQNSATYSFVVDVIEYDLLIQTEDVVQGLVARGTLQNLQQEYVQDTISYGETLRYVASPNNDFGFLGWTTSLEDDAQIFSSNLTLTIAFNESLFAEGGLFDGVTLDAENPLSVYATFTKNVCDITFGFSVNNENTNENITNISINGVRVTPNEDGTITYKQAMNTPIVITFDMPSGYEFESWYNPNGGTLSMSESLTLNVGEEETMQIIINFTRDDDATGGMGYIWWIIGGSVAGILVIGLVVFLIVKKRKDNSYKNMYY